MFPKEPEIMESMNYKSPLGKSDHIVIELLVNARREVGKREEHKIGRYIYNKSKFYTNKEVFLRSRLE